MKTFAIYFNAVDLLQNATVTLKLLYNSFEFFEYIYNFEFIYFLSKIFVLFLKHTQLGMDSLPKGHVFPAVCSWDLFWPHHITRYILKNSRVAEGLIHYLKDFVPQFLLL